MAIGGVLLAAAGAGLFVGFPARGMAGELARQAQERLGVRLTVGTASFSVVRGLQFDDVTATATSERLMLTAQIERLHLQHQLSPATRVRVKRIVLLNPSIDLTIGQRQASDERPATADTTPADKELVRPDGPNRTPTSFLRFDGTSVDLTGASVEARPPRGSAYPLRAIALNVSLDGVGRRGAAPSMLQGLFANGQFNAAEFWLGRVRLQRARGDLTMDNGHVLISGLLFRCDDSELFLPELDIDLTSEPFSFGTASNVYERAATNTSPDDWVPITSFARLNRMCS